MGEGRGLGIELKKGVFVKEMIGEENKVIMSDNVEGVEKNEM